MKHLSQVSESGVAEQVEGLGTAYGGQPVWRRYSWTQRGCFVCFTGLGQRQGQGNQEDVEKRGQWKRGNSVYRVMGVRWEKAQRQRPQTMQTKHSLCSTAKPRAREEACLPRLQRQTPHRGGPGCPAQPPPAGGAGRTALLYGHNENKEKPTMLEHQRHVTSSFKGLTLETDLSRRQPVSPRKRNMAEGAGRKAGKPMAPLPHSPCQLIGPPCEWAGRVWRSLRSAEGRGLALSHPGGP